MRPEEIFRSTGQSVATNRENIFRSDVTICNNRWPKHPTHSGMAPGSKCKRPIPIVIERWDAVKGLWKTEWSGECAMVQVQRLMHMELAACRVTFGPATIVRWRVVAHTPAFGRNFFAVLQHRREAGGPNPRVYDIRRASSSPLL